MIFYYEVPTRSGPRIMEINTDSEKSANKKLLKYARKELGNKKLKIEQLFNSDEFGVWEGPMSGEESYKRILKAGYHGGDVTLKLDG